MLVKPEQKELFVMGSEPILCQDGAHKNDCEPSAAKRLLDWLSNTYPHQPLLLTEDALYANGPHICQITQHNFSYILGIKPDGNKSLFTAFEQNHRVKRLSFTRQGVKHDFRYLNNLPFNSSHPDLRVNVLLYEQTDKQGKTTRFSWVTNLALNHKNLEHIMAMGPSRWTMEPGGEYCHRR